MSSVNPWLNLVLIVAVLLYITRAVWRSYKEVKELHFGYAVGTFSGFATAALSVILFLVTLIQVVLGVLILLRFTGDLPKP